ncbi:PAS domain-containing protein [Marinobacter hydrocarbonoclasticus]|uniref:PAS domain-containing protein n=1 Tax=Marinobacter nauticus TaxID=2743 RepID=UPI001A9040FF|nr:PAS domain-containing protein [Marinobacter nauticus]MBN8237620.1 PAS domain-containing protein [Marinobacter nauticus]
MVRKHGHPDTEQYESLRRNAKYMLDNSASPRKHGGSISMDALQLLYQKACSPESAVDALRLLHELQTYQVELDLLYEQLEANEQELSDRLLYYQSIYENAPAAYLQVTKAGEILEANQAAASLFASSSPPLIGKLLLNLVAPGQNHILKPILEWSEVITPDAGTIKTASVVLADQRQLTVNARLSENGDVVLMILTETPQHSTGF